MLSSECLVVRFLFYDLGLLSFEQISSGLDGPDIDAIVELAVDLLKSPLEISA